MSAIRADSFRHAISAGALDQAQRREDVIGVDQLDPGKGFLECPVNGRGQRVQADDTQAAQFPLAVKLSA